jgi:phage terminase large subunit
VAEITLPHLYKAREYQKEFWDAWDSDKYDIFVLNWHRRAGKDVTCWNATIDFASMSPMTVKYAFPTGDMARDNLWESYTNDGMRFTDFVPEELRFKRNKGDDGLNDSLKSIELLTGGSIRVISAHKPGRLRGGNSKLFVLSELQAMDPSVIDIIEPILEANHGRLLVNLTSNGDSAAKRMVEDWKKDPRVYVSILTVEDTPVFTEEQMVRIRKRTVERFLARGQSEEEAHAFVDQEYYCNWDSPVVGSYFGAAMRRAAEQERITRVPYETQLPVHTFWDLGVDDSMSIWFMQFHGREIRCIDYYEASGEGFKYYAKVLNGQHEGFEHMGDYLYGKHYAPHDIRVRNMGKDARTRQDVAADLGLKFEVVKRVSQKEDGIEAIRTVLGRCWFDEDKCQRGIEALKGYKKEWNEKLMVYKDTPVHDWTSHGTDAFQTMAIVVDDITNTEGAALVTTAPPAQAAANSYLANEFKHDMSNALREAAEDV